MSDKKLEDMTGEELLDRIIGIHDFHFTIPAHNEVYKELLRRLNAGASTGQDSLGSTQTGKERSDRSLDCPASPIAGVGSSPTFPTKSAAATTPGQPAMVASCPQCSTVHKCPEDHYNTLAGHPSVASPRCPKCSNSALDRDGEQVKCRACGESFETPCVSDFAQFFAQPTPDVEQVSSLDNRFAQIAPQYCEQHKVVHKCGLIMAEQVAEAVVKYYSRAKYPRLAANENQAMANPPGAGSLQTRFAEFDDIQHPFNQWWQKHGQFMMSGGGHKQFIWACRGWIAREQMFCGVEVTGESLNEKQPSGAGEGPQRYGIYIASKTKHAAKWKELRASGQPIISTWINEAGIDETNSFEDLWRRCIDETGRAERLVVYAEDGDELKGALVEVGAALASGTPVWVVGNVEALKTALNHRLMHKVASLKEAFGGVCTQEPPAALAPVNHEVEQKIKTKLKESDIHPSGLSSAERRINPAALTPQKERPHENIMHRAFDYQAQPSTSGSLTEAPQKEPK